MADDSVQGWTEMSFPVPWGSIQAKCWGNPSAKPFLGIHGWLDNANTFDKLAPLLPSDIYLVAVDLPGHGRSSDRFPGVPYNRIDWIIDVKRVVLQLGWKKFSLIGHSLGAFVALLYAGTFPEEIESAILIEIRPRSYDNFKSAPAILATSAKVLTSNSKSLKEYENIGAAAKRLLEVNKEITEEDAKCLIKRSIVYPNNPSKHDRIWIKADPRLRFFTGGIYKGSTHGFYDGEVNAMLDKIQCRVLTIFGKDCHPSYIIKTKNYLPYCLGVIRKKASYYEEYHISGNHFVHLNNPETVAEKIRSFLGKCMTLRSKL